MPVPARDIALGSRVPWFQVETIDHSEVLTPESAKDPATGKWRPLLVMFLCNHSPYVRNIESHLSGMIREWQAHGLYAIAISPNDPISYPSDDEQHLRDQVTRTGFSFPYALDENQSLARAFEASCTPEFYLYGDMDRGGRLVYHGEYDKTRPGHPEQPTGEPLVNAIRAVINLQNFRDNQEPSFGCSVKWKSGQDATVARVLS